MSQHKKSNNRRKSAAVALAVLGVAGLTLASAAQLEFAPTTSVQAGVTTVADCQPADEKITVAFATPEFSAGEYRSSSVALGDINSACNGKNFAVTFINGSDAPINEVTGRVADGAITAAFTGSHHAVAEIAVAIY